jgi:16S rRNA (guanine527-N7)-methyltransferase
LDQLLHLFPDLTDLQISQFEKLRTLYTDWNSKINVISRKDIDELYLRHVIHSLAIARFIHFTPGTKILDIGTGGGFPGIPLAIYFSECQFMLCDSIAKKIKVVDEISLALALKNCSTYIGRAEQINYKADFIVSRAVAPISQLISWTKTKLERHQKNNIGNGWIFLKGGDLIEEASASGRNYQILPLQTWFSDSFFESKRIVYIKG